MKNVYSDLGIRELLDLGHPEAVFHTSEEQLTSASEEKPCWSARLSVTYSSVREL